MTKLNKLEIFLNPATVSKAYYLPVPFKVLNQNVIKYKVARPSYSCYRSYFLT